MIHIIQVETDEHKYYLRELFRENIDSSNLKINREFGVNLDVNVILEEQMAKLQQFAPPEGRLLLGEYQGRIAGCAGLRKIGEDVGEVKRMYVITQFRRKGIGRSLLKAIINQASQIGYSKIRLDTPPFAKEAQALYRALGFQEIAPYPESEIPEEYHPNWLFMELLVDS